jgi:hypothetical protein
MVVWKYPDNSIHKGSLQTITNAQLTDAGVYTVIATDTLFTPGYYSPDGPNTLSPACSTTTTVTVTVSESFTEEHSVTICESQLPYTWRDTTFQTGTVTNDYVFHRKTPDGCDSIVTLHLTVDPYKESTENLTICQDELPYTWRDTTFQAGTVTNDFVFHRKTAQNCDSIVTLHLTVNPSVQREAYDTICERQLPYAWGSDTTFLAGTESGEYIFRRQTVLGCDSIVTLHLLVKDSVTLVVHDTICAGQTYKKYGFNLYLPGGNDYHLKTSLANICDTLVDLYLRVNQTYSTIDEQIACDSFTWIDGVTYTSSTTTPTWKLTSSAGCDSVVTLHLTILKPSVTSLTAPDVTVCAGSQINLHATATGDEPISYSWSGVNNFSSNEQNPSITGATAANAGDYIVIATSTLTFGTKTCTAMDTDTVTVAVLTPSVENLQAPNITVCAGETINLSATAEGTNITYSWSSPTGASLSSTTIPNASSSNAGNYTVTATSTVGTCTVTATAVCTVTVNTPSVTNLAAPNITVCAGETINLSATAEGPGITYSWSSPTGAAQSSTSIPNASSSNAGNYTVTATSTVGTCTVTATAVCTVTVNTPSVTNLAAPNITVCAGETINLSATAEGPGITYSWSSPTGAAQSSTSIPNASSSNAGNYTVTATSTVGTCTVTATAVCTVTVNTPSVTNLAAPNITVCAGETINLSATAEGTNITYSWSSPTGAAQSSTSIPNASSSNAGNYTVTATSTVGTCTVTATAVCTVTVNTPSVTNLTAQNVKVCANDPINLTAIATGVGTISYSWSGVNGFSSDEQSPSIEHAAEANEGDYVVTVTATQTVNTVECSATANATVHVTVDTIPNIVITGNTPICRGESTTLTATGAVNYTWSDGLGSTNPVNVTPLLTHTYEIQGVDGNKCVGFAEYEVVVKQPSYSTVKDTACGSYTWHGTTYTSTPATAPEYHTTNAVGCDSTVTLLLTLYPNPVLQISTGNFCSGDDLIVKLQTLPQTPPIYGVRTSMAMTFLRPVRSSRSR